MRKEKLGLVIVSLVLLCVIAVNITGCTTKIHAENLMASVTPNNVVALDDLSSGNADATDFAIRLFKQANKNGESTLISPLSVMCALAMTANGAEGKTREQMEDVLGMSVEDLNLYLYSYINSLPQGEKYKLSSANSIWFTNDEKLVVNQDFLQANADYYGADVYKTPFNNKMVRDVNNWVSNKTDNMIPSVLEDVLEDEVMYLINALAFEAEWSSVYEEWQVQDRTFTKEDGTKQDVELMYSTEGKYLEDENATGFIKYYKHSRYAFVALLPNEGVGVAEYIDSLDGKALADMLANAKSIAVEAAIPKFEVSCSYKMEDTLKAMGMSNAFGSLADFSKMGNYDGESISISRVIHKTYIQVGEKGTRAGAVTAVAMNGAASPEEVKQVYLDRPFVYMLIDCENNVPFFIGTVMGIE